MDNCLFCKIIKGEIPSYKIYEDEYTYAFLDIAKDYIGHTIVVSKDHKENILKSSNEELIHIFDTIKLISNHYINNCGYDGVNILNNCNPSAGQTIMHTHFHIIPRKDNDNLYIYNEMKNENIDLEKIYQELKI